MAKFLNSELALSSQLDLSSWRLECLSFCDGRMEARLIPFDNSYDFNQFFYGSLGKTFHIGKDVYTISDIFYSVEAESCDYYAQSFEIVAYRTQKREPHESETCGKLLTTPGQGWYNGFKSLLEK